MLIEDSQLATVRTYYEYGCPVLEWCWLSPVAPIVAGVLLCRDRTRGVPLPGTGIEIVGMVPWGAWAKAGAAAVGC